MINTLWPGTEPLPALPTGRQAQAGIEQIVKNLCVQRFVRESKS
jgi:hypothetical protein